MVEELSSTGSRAPGEALRPAVLLVDDEPNLLAALRRQLFLRYDVTTCESGAEGLQRLAEKPFVVVVSDMRMPGMDGAEFLRRARALAPNTTRVLLTGQTDVDAAIAAINDGQIFRFLNKPCSPDVLEKCLQDAVVRHLNVIGTDALEPAARDRHAVADNSLPGAVLAAGLASGLSNGEFRLQYQPVVSMRTGETVGVDTLVRWHHPERGVMAAEEFVPLAEASGVVHALGRWMIASACDEVASWPAQPMFVAVTVSLAQLHRQDFCSDVELALSASGLRGRRVLVQITEAALSDVVAGRALRALRELGVRVALVGVSSAVTEPGSFGDQPVDVVKIDRALIARLPADADADAACASIVRAAKSLDAEVAAEGVDTVAQHNACRELGCHSAQGALYATPMEPADLLAALAENALGVRRPEAIADSERRA